jgi:hypothetical protein
VHTASRAHDRAASAAARHASAQHDGGPIPAGLGFGLFNPNDPVQAGIAIVTIVLGAAAIAFFTSLIVAGFRARRALLP